MKINIFSIALLIFAFGAITGARSQSATSLSVSARSYSDRIVLRYLPSTPILFNQGNKLGYRIERADFIKGTPIEKLAFKPIKVALYKRWSNTQWEKTMLEQRKTDTLEAKLIGLAMAYSDPSADANGDILKDGLKSLKEEKRNTDMKYGYALIAANRSRLAAEGLGLLANDFDVKVGQTYVYRIYINQPGSAPMADAAYITTTCTDFNEKYLRNDKLVKITALDEAVSFSFPETDEYYAFNVARSDDGGITYRRISGTATLNVRPTGFVGSLDFAYGDSALTNYKKYYYRIMVTTYFADELLLAQFSAMPKDKTPPPTPFLKTATHLKPNQVELKWEMNLKGATDLKGFMISRGDKEDGKFTVISKTMLSSASNSYIDETFDREGANYYIVEAIDTAGNSSRSFPAYVTLIDSIPPGSPVISSAKIDSLGKITIKIKPNTEKDFMGYQLQKANAREHDFSVVVETFKDSLGRSTFTLKDSTTLQTLTKKIYYKVIAFDTHFNQSRPSVIIELKKRDTIPPVSPLIKDFMISDTAVVIVFANSSSEDAGRNYLLRKEMGKLKFDTVFVNENPAVSKFIDTKIVGGKQYEYAMIARDEGGLRSKISNSIQIKTLLNNRIPSPELFGVYNAASKKIEISFKLDEKIVNRKLTIEIYQRKDEKSAWTDFKSFPYVKNQPLLENITADQKTHYYVMRLVDENKNSSNFSNELSIKL
jgi:hypothetical protein